MLPTRFGILANTFRSRGIPGLWRLGVSHLNARSNPRVRRVESPFLGWLFAANAGLMHRGNVYCIEIGVRDCPPDTAMIEIGSFCGLSANVITHMKERHGVDCSLFTCDAWDFETRRKEGMLGDSRQVGYEEYRRFVRESCLRNMRMFSGHDLPRTIELPSDDFFAAWAADEERADVFERVHRLGGPVGFCYIDGAHAYDQARRDFENCDRFLVPGGHVLFDDSSDGSGWDVCRLVAEVERSGGYERVIRNPNYLLRKRR